jgi:hypothetical protein
VMRLSAGIPPCAHRLVVSFTLSRDAGVLGQETE